MKNIFRLLFISVCSVAVLNSCKGGTESGDNYKDPREMAWTCDTLYFNDVGQTSLEHFLAFDIKSIYAYGWSSDYKNIWRFDGNKWSLVDISNYVVGFVPNKLIGFSPTNIYGFGSNLSKIIRYNGSEWYEVADAGTISARLITACASSPSNIYAAGDNGLIMFYNGNAWHRDQIKMYVPNGGFYVIRSSAVWKDTTYLMTYHTNNLGRDVYHLIKGTYQNWVVADSMVIDNFWAEWKWGWYGMRVTPDNKLISFGTKGIWEYNGKSWSKIYDSPDNLVYDVFTLNKNYRIAVCAFLKVAFYDGSTWTNLSRLSSFSENVEYSDAWGDGKELFIMGFTTGSFPQKTIIWHGK